MWPSVDGLTLFLSVLSAHSSNILKEDSFEIIFLASLKPLFEPALKR